MKLCLLAFKTVTRCYRIAKYTNPSKDNLNYRTCTFKLRLILKLLPGTTMYFKWALRIECVVSSAVQKPHCVIQSSEVYPDCNKAYVTPALFFSVNWPASLVVAEVRKWQLKDNAKWFGTTVSYLLGWMKSESRDPACDCHLRLLGSFLGSLHSCKKSAQLLHS